MSHQTSEDCCSMFAICQIFLLLFVLHASLSHSFYPFPMFHSFSLSVCLAVSVSALSTYVCIWPLGAVRANIDLWFGGVPDPPACTARPSANLLLISWKDEAIALFLHIAFDEWRIISTRSISLLQWSHLCIWTNTNCEPWMFYQETRDIWL